MNKKRDGKVNKITSKIVSYLATLPEGTEISISEVIGKLYGKESVRRRSFREIHYDAVIAGLPFHNSYIIKRKD